jgi:hypothetical protein
MITNNLMKMKYTYQTMSGIASDTFITRDIVRSTLDVLEKKICNKIY